MSKVKNDAGNKYGRLIVVSRAENNQDGLARWSCQCQCGNLAVVGGAQLRKGHDVVGV